MYKLYHMKLFLPAGITFVVSILAYIVINIIQHHTLTVDIYKAAVVCALGAAIGMALVIRFVRKRSLDKAV